MAFLKTLMQHIGQFQSRLILSVVYFTLILLFAPVAWFFDQSLNLKGFRDSRESAWIPRKSEASDLARGKLQF